MHPTYNDDLWWRLQITKKKLYAISYNSLPLLLTWTNDERTIKNEAETWPNRFPFSVSLPWRSNINAEKLDSLSFILSLWTLVIYQFDFKGLKDLNRLHIHVMSCQPLNNKMQLLMQSYYSYKLIVDSHTTWLAMRVVLHPLKR